MENFKNTGIDIVVSSEIDEAGQALVLRFDGFLDKSTVSSVQDYLMDGLRDFSGRVLVLDFGELNYINSEGIGFLMMLSSFLTKQRKKLLILGAQIQVKDIFNAVGLPNVIECFDSVETCKGRVSVFLSTS